MMEKEVPDILLLENIYSGLVFCYLIIAQQGKFSLHQTNFKKNIIT